MPTARDAAPLFDALDAHTIGELRVEVLECENLPNLDSMVGVDSLFTGNKTDSYAMLMFEGVSARTSIIFDDLNPRWGASTLGSFRAFRFPVTTPYSVLYVSINDYDGAQKQSEAEVGAASTEVSTRVGWNSDDPIGRVAIQLGRLASATVYDAWYELGYSSIEQPDGKRGSVRLRFSLTFKSPRARMLAYLKPPPHTPIIPFNKQSYRVNAIFAKNGEVEAGEYDWDILMHYVEEIKLTIKILISGVAAFEDVLLWRSRSRVLSISTCVGFQLLISRPNYFPAACCMVALVVLASTYGMENEDLRQNEPIHRRVDFLHLCKALISDRQPPPLVVKSPRPAATAAARVQHHAAAAAAAPLTEASTSVRRDSEQLQEEEGGGYMDAMWSWTAQGAVETIRTEIRNTAYTYWREKILGDQEVEQAAAKEYEKRREEIEEEVEAFIDEGDDSLEDKLVKKGANRRKRTVLSTVKAALNPVAVVLGPAQAALRKVIFPLRNFHHVIFWQDRILTLWICVGLVGVALVFALVPWGFVLYYGARLAGVALFGPHMYFLGRKIDGEREQAASERRAFIDANEAGREQILADYEKKLMKAAKAQVAKAQKKLAARSESQLALVGFLEKQRYNFINKNTRGNVSIKFAAAADPLRSSARALVVDAETTPCSQNDEQQEEEETFV